MTFAFGSRSQARLDTCHPDLRRVMRRAIASSPIDFTILEGVRTPQRQRQLFAQGATRTMKSRHLPGGDGLSRAVDVAPLIAGEVRWDWPLYHRLSAVIKQAAAEEKVPIEWGGDWRSFKDGPHWQLPWAKYP